MRSTPAAQPTRRRRRPAELLHQPVVAPAAAQLGLGAELRALELEHGARVVVEAAHERADRAGRRRPPGRAGREPRRSARRPRRRGARASSAPRPSPPACPRPWSRTRAAGSRRCARGRPAQAPSHGSAGRRPAPRGRPCRVAGEPRLESRSSTTAPRARAAARRAGRSSSASTSGSSEPIASAPSWLNWR